MDNSKDILWNSNYNKVMVTNFSMYFAFYLLTPLFPIYLSQNFNASKDVIGFALFGYAIAALLTRPFCGFIVDSFDRKKVLLLCLLVNSIFFAGYIAASSLLLFVIVRTLHGAPFGASTVANNTVAIDVLPSSMRTEGIGFYGISNNIASAIAPTAAIFIYHAADSFQLLFFIAFFSSVIGLAVNSTIKMPARQTVKNKQPISLDRFFLTRGWLIALNITCFGFCWGMLSNYLAIYGKEQLDITSGTGTFFLLLSLGLIVSRIWGAKSLRKGNILHNAAEGVIISSAGYLVFILLPTPLGYYSSAFLIGLGNGHMYPAYQNMIIGVAHNFERGTANSTILTMWDLGQGIGILSGGLLAEHFGFTAAFAVNAAIHVLGSIIFFTHTKRFYIIRHRLMSLAEHEY